LVKFEEPREDSITMYDTIELDDAAKVRFTSDGYLVATPRIARTGVQIYGGRECGMDNVDAVRVYRPRDEVFHKDAAHSYTHRPVTLDHPPVTVDANNWKKYAVGQTGDEVLADGGTIRVPMVLMDAQAIKAYKDGTKQLSVGYSCDLEWSGGVTEDGEQYDAIQRNIRANHLAVVAAARGGPTLVIGDDNEGDKAMNLKTLTIDGFDVQVPERDAQIVTRYLNSLQKQLRDMHDEWEKKKKKGDDDDEKCDALTKEIAKLTETIKTKDAELATVKQTVKDAELTPAKLNAAVKDRMAVLTKARALMADKADGYAELTNDEIRKAVVLAKMGDQAKEWSDVEIRASFNTIALPSFSAPRSSGPGYGQMGPAYHVGGDSGMSAIDEARAVFGRPGGPTNLHDAREQAYRDYENDVTNAWQGNKRVPNGG